MEKKGLCDTCDNDKSCISQKRFPILQCEEFVNSNHKATEAKQPKQKKVECCEAVTTEE